jgi:Protein of unknown function (DUF3073)
MGRGRAKAKQQKVARALKYSSHDTDLDALQRELSSSGDGASPKPPEVDDDVDEIDEYDEYPDDDRWTSAR